MHIPPALQNAKLGDIVYNLQIFLFYYCIFDAEMIK